MPLNEDGSFREVYLRGKGYKGQALYDFIEQYVRKGYYLPESEAEEKTYGQDLTWFAWSNENSPVFGKEKMATFERYFLGEPEVQEERKDPYYRLIEDERVCEEICNNILREFKLNPENGHIINGHMPVKLKKGESRLKATENYLSLTADFPRLIRRRRESPDIRWSIILTA